MNQISEENKAYQIGILSLIISAICLIFMYLGVGYTTTDEMNIELWAYLPAPTGILHGRLNSFLSYYLAIFPHWIYKVSGFNLFNLVNLLAIASSLVLFSLTIYKATQQKFFAIFIAIFFLAAIQNNWEYNVLTSYTFYMNISISLLIISLHIFLEYFRSDNILLWMLSALVFLLTLFVSYEFFFLYVIIFVFIAAFYNKQINPTLNRSAILAAFYISALHLMAVVIFLTAYFIIRLFYPSIYDGLVVKFSINALQVIYQYTISSFPTYIYFHYPNLFDTYSDLTQGHSYTIYSFLSQMKAEWLIKSIVVSYFVYIVLQNRLIIISNRMFAGLTMVSIYIMLVPNILVSITDKYQSWVINHDSLAYATTYYSYFGTILLIVSGILFLNQKFNNNTIILKILKQCYVWCITIVIAFMTIATDYSNYYVFKEQKISQQKWIVLDSLVKSKHLDLIPTGSFIYAPSLFSTRGIDKRGILDNFSDYWTKYLTLKYNKEVVISKNIKELKNKLIKDGTKDLYYLKFSQEQKDTHQFMLFAKIQKIANDSIFLSSDAVIVSNSNRKKFLVFGRNLSTNMDTLTLPTTNVAVFIDNELAQKDGNFFSRSIHKQKIRNDFTSTYLKIIGDALLDLESISISSYTDHKLYNIDL